MSDWREMFEQRRGQTPEPTGDSYDDGAEFERDARVYKPWLIQRGRGRPLLFLDLRRVEPKTGMVMGCQMGYSHLVAIDYLGERMATLDFGVRHFVVEGDGLQELVTLLQQGAVLTIQEYSPKLWPERPDGPVVTRITQVAAKADNLGP